MKKFLSRLLIFTTPLVAFLLPPAFVLLRSGENFTRIDALIKSEEPYVIGYVYNEDNYRYLKWKTIESHPRFTVMTIGSSRVLEFRRQMFDRSFYNAGYTVVTINDFVPFLSSLSDEKLPSYLIVGIDQWMFNESTDRLERVPPVQMWENSFEFMPTTSTIFNVWDDLLSSKYGPDIAKQHIPERLGLNSLVRDTGFREDGSILYGEQKKKRLSHDSSAWDYAYSDTFNRINNASRPFQYGETINPKALTKLSELLQFCKHKGVVVIGVLPPFANGVYDKLSSMDEYRYMKMVYPACKPIFENYGFELYDFTNPIAIGSIDKEFFDGGHGSEVTGLRILLRILNANSSLGDVCDLKKLSDQLENRKSPLEVY